jgi:phage repressor protein C with HTH and peptisase S24 domain
MLQKLIEQGREVSGSKTAGSEKESAGQNGADKIGNRTSTSSVASQSAIGNSVNLDDAYLSGVLQDLVDRSSGNVETVATNAVPVINRVSAGYPKDFTDLSYPKGVADDYVGCPDVADTDAFAARVAGDSMTPKYTEGDIVIFSPASGVRNGDDCFVRFADGHTTFKRVFFESDERGTSVLRLQPRNERYRPQTVASDQVSGLYKAVYKYQRVDGE